MPSKGLTLRNAGHKPQMCQVRVLCMLVGRAKDPSGSFTTCWIKRLRNNLQAHKHFSPYLIISIVIPQENHKTENTLMFYDCDNMTSSMRGQRDLVLMQGRPEKFPAAHAHNSSLFSAHLHSGHEAETSSPSPFQLTLCHLHIMTRSWR